jgi:hypothetical protein
VFLERLKSPNDPYSSLPDTPSSFLCCCQHFKKENTPVASIYALFDAREEGEGRRLGGKIEQHSLISTLLAGGDLNQWRKEHRRTKEEQEALDDRHLQVVVNPDILLTLDVIFTYCLFAVSCSNLYIDLSDRLLLDIVTSPYFFILRKTRLPNRAHLRSRRSSLLNSLRTGLSYMILASREISTTTLQFRSVIQSLLCLNYFAACFFTHSLLTQTLCSPPPPPPPPPQGLGAAIEAVGPLIVKNCCFLDNEFLRYAPVVLIEEFATLTASENYGNVIGDPDLACDFAIFFDDVVDYENVQNFRCVEFDATECTHRGDPLPPDSPVMAPTPDMPPSRPTRFTEAPAMTPGDTTNALTAGADGSSIMFLSTAVAAVAVYFAL